MNISDIMKALFEFENITRNTKGFKFKQGNEPIGYRTDTATHSFGMKNRGAVGLPPTANQGLSMSDITRFRNAGFNRSSSGFDRGFNGF